MVPLNLCIETMTQHFTYRTNQVSLAIDSVPAHQGAKGARANHVSLFFLVQSKGLVKRVKRKIVRNEKSFRKTRNRGDLS
jgi:hypothetical protein